MSCNADELLKLVATLDEAKREINLARQQSTKPQHLYIRVRRGAVQAARAMVAAVDMGFEQSMIQWVLSGLRHPDDKKRPPTLLKKGDLSFEVSAIRLGSGCNADGTLPDDTAFDLWKMFICPFLRSEHVALKADAGGFDFPTVKTDKLGRVLGRDGKPLERIGKVNPETGEPCGWELNGPAATVADEYDEADALEHLRCQAADWADACDVAADLLRESATAIAAEPTRNARERRLAAPRGSFEAQRLLATEEAEELEAESQKTAHPDLAALYGNVVRAWAAAVSLAAASRSTKPVDTVQFVGLCTRLAEHYKRAEELAKHSALWDAWPKDPGTTFAWKGGDSALDVAHQFARAIFAAMECAGLIAFGGVDLDPLLVAPEPDERFSKWRDETIKELLEKTLAPVTAWAMWDIHRERAALESKLKDEWGKVSDFMQARLDSVGRQVEAEPGQEENRGRPKSLGSAPNDSDTVQADPIEEGLSGQPLKLYRFLPNGRHWTDYTTLANKNDFWRSENPDVETIHRALRRLREELNRISGAPHLTIEGAVKRVRLEQSGPK